jgi:hypothetical protein
MFQIKYVYDLVDKISPKLTTIQTNLKNTSNKVEESALKMSSGFDKVKSNLDKIGNKSSQLGRNLILKTTLPLGLLGNKFIKTASDYQESLNKVDVAFGSAANSVKSFSESAGKNFGIDRGSALDMAAMFGDMSTSMGLSQTKAADLSTKLVGLAGDLASFKNINVGEATTALAGIFTGETESLKRLGIVMTEVNLQQFALTNGITKKIQKMSQDEKVLLRYNYIMAMTKNSQGDFARTQTGFANQTRILSSRFKDLSITLGSILLPYANKILGVIINLIEKFQALSPTTQKIILVLGTLAAIIPPLLIAFGFMASGIVAIGAALALLISPVGLIIAGITALAAAGYLLKDSFMVVFNFLKDEFLLIFDAIGAKIDAAIAKFNSFRTDAASVLSFVGLDSLANSVAPSQVNQAASQNINQQQQVTAGGQMDINIKGLPKGSNSNFTPAPKSFMNIGVNSVYAGG